MLYHSPLVVIHFLIVAFHFSDVGKFTFFGERNGFCNNLIVVGFKFVSHLASLPRIEDCSAYHLVFSANRRICDEKTFLYHSSKNLWSKNSRTVYGCKNSQSENSHRRNRSQDSLYIIFLTSRK